MIKLRIIVLVSVLVLTVLIIFYLTDNNNPKTYLSGKIELKDGLIYNISTDRLFTGILKDTVGEKIIEYDVTYGKKNGRFNVYNKNGTPQLTGYMKNNKNDGEWYYYFPDGSVECRGIFKNDKITDKWVWFYPNGNIKEEGFYINGVREGSWVRYDPDGNIDSRVSFKEDIIIDELKAEKFNSI